MFCFGACNPQTKLNYAKVADSATNKGRVSRATAYSTYVRNPRTTAPTPTAPVPTASTHTGSSMSISSTLIAPVSSTLIAPVSSTLIAPISITRIERISNTQLNIYFNTSLSGLSILGYGVSLNDTTNSYGDMSPLSVYGLTLNTNYVIGIFAVRLDGSATESSATASFYLQ
jgi:hypothetical protein